MFDKQGNCQGGADGPDGLFYQDTRFLSGLGLRVGGMEPLQLSSVVLDDNGAMIVDLANADLHDPDGKIWLQRDSVYVGRLKFLCGTTCYERIRVRRFGPVGRTIPLEISFDADFADLFEVRGERRAKRGTRKVAKIDDCTVRFSYVGLDDVQRLTTLHFEPAPSQLDERRARWDLDLDASRADQPGDQDRLQDRRRSGRTAAYPVSLSDGPPHPPPAQPRPGVRRAARTNCSTPSSIAR